MIEKAALYCRLSKEDGDLTAGNISESIKNQKLLLKDYALRQGWEVYDIYCDEDYRGFDRNRPEFNRLLKDAKAGAFNIVLCKHQSRFTRDMELVEHYINGRFVLWGIRFVSITDNIDTLIKGNKKARQINGLINEWYSEDMSENIRAVFRRKMAEGQFVGAFTCFGYRKSEADRHKIVVDPEAAAIVKEIFDLYLSGYGTAKIGTILTKRNRPTPLQYKKLTNVNYAHPKQNIVSGVWSASTIKHILTNETYIGTLIQGKEKKVSYKMKKTVAVPKEQWIKIPNNHEAIIDIKVFKSVQSLLRSRRRTCDKMEKGAVIQTMPNIFAGKIKCADCGATMQRSGISRDKSTYYYRCSLSAKTKQEKCSPHCIRQDKIEQILIHKIQSMIVTTNRKNNWNLEEIYKKAEKKYDKAGLKKSLEMIERLIEKNSLLLANAYADKISGDLSIEAFEEIRYELENSRIELNNRKNSFSEMNKNFEKKRTEPPNLNDIKRHAFVDQLNYDIVNDFIDTIEIREDIEANEQTIILNWDF